MKERRGIVDGKLLRKLGKAGRLEGEEASHGYAQIVLLRRRLITTMTVIVIAMMRSPMKPTNTPTKIFFSCESPVAPVEETWKAAVLPPDVVAAPIVSVGAIVFTSRVLPSW